MKSHSASPKDPHAALRAAVATALTLGAVSTAAQPPSASRGSAPRSFVTAAYAADGDPSDAVASSDAFIQSIGVNTHFENHYTVYATRFSDVESALVSAGIRHIRAGMIFGNATFLKNMKALGAAGIDGDFITRPEYTRDQIQSFPGLIAPAFAFFEAPNEPDDQAKQNPAWADQTRRFQMDLYSWVKSSDATKHYPVLGPSVVSHFAELGDVSAYMDYANIHDYTRDYNPGTLGWGRTYPEGVYGSIQYNLHSLRHTSGSKPVIATEAGYDAPQVNATTLSLRAQMRYVSRLFFEQFNNGIVRTYLYELIDKGGEDVAGMLRTDLSPKPSFTAVKSIIAALRDPGPPFATSPLRLTLGGDTANVHHTVLEKRDGTYVVALWIETKSWKPNGGGDIMVPDQSITVTAGRRLRSAALQTMNEDGTLISHALRPSDTGIAISVSDKISLLTLSP